MRGNGFAATQRANDQPVDAELECLVLVQRAERSQHVFDFGVDAGIAAAKGGRPVRQLSLVSSFGSATTLVDQPEFQGARGGDVLAGSGEPERVSFTYDTWQPRQYEARGARLIPTSGK